MKRVEGARWYKYEELHWNLQEWFAVVQLIMLFSYLDLNGIFCNWIVFVFLLTTCNIVKGIALNCQYVLIYIFNHFYIL
jgi:hypothetical protein